MLGYPNRPAGLFSDPAVASPSQLQAPSDAPSHLAMFVRYKQRTSSTYADPASLCYTKPDPIGRADGESDIPPIFD